jgi:hypothetical protein
VAILIVIYIAQVLLGRQIIDDVLSAQQQLPYPGVFTEAQGSVNLFFISISYIIICAIPHEFFLFFSLAWYLLAI